MLKIKLSNQFPEWDWLRQTPGSKGIWKDAVFYVNREDITECDYYFVMGGLNKKENVICPPENTFFIALENIDIHLYNESFLNQFHYIVTHRKDIKHPRVINSVFPAYWFIGIDTSVNRVNSDKSYDYLKSTNVNASKTKLISVISSNKQITEGHRKRLAFVEILKKEFGNTIDVYGRGINSFKDKWDVLAPYKYHIVLENSSYEDEITEKLYDSFLAQCFSFYYGSKNVKKYFDEDSFCEIDINDPVMAVDRIKSKIADDIFTESYHSRLRSKKEVLDKYNLFNLIHEHITSLGFRETELIGQTFYTEDFFMGKQNFEEQSIFNRVKSKLRRILHR